MKKLSVVFTVMLVLLLLATPALTMRGGPVGGTSGRSARIAEAGEDIAYVSADNDGAQTYTAVAADGIELERIGAYAGDGSEIAGYDPASGRLFVVTGGNDMLVLDINDPVTPTLVLTISMTAYGGGANSVAVKDGIVAVAVANSDRQLAGKVVFFDTDGAYINDVDAGALPDMVKFTPDGSKVLVANEGEPNDDYDVDPEGTVSVIDISGGVVSATVTSIGFTDFNVGGSRNAELPADVRIFGANATVAQDLEPEYIAVSADSTTAWVVLQENNALAVIDLETLTVDSIAALGFKDHSLLGNELDPSNEDSGIMMANWPVWGMYQPDAIDAFEIGGQSYIISANEGDARDYDGYSEEVRIRDLVLDTTVFTDAASLQEDANLGRLKTTTAYGDIDMDGDFDVLYAYGARSFSIWDATGALVFDSANRIETLTAALYPEAFNSQGTPASFDSRSDDKGPEPEGVVVGNLAGRSYAFIGLERIGGVMVFDVTDPTAPVFQTYVHTGDLGDISPEGLLFIPESDSPSGEPLLVVAYEVSGTTVIYQIKAPELSVTKTVETPPAPIGPGDTVTYTIEIANTGNLTATDVTVDDVLPPAVIFGVWLEGNNSSIIMPPPSISWAADSVPPGVTYRLRFTAVVAPDATLLYAGTSVVNTVDYASLNAGSGSDDAAFNITAYVFLPLVMRNID